MALYAFSDAHLGCGSKENEENKYQKIAELFEKVKQDGDRLVILGDLFDFWFEYKSAIPKDQFRVLNLLYNLKSNGLQIDYISGNHDFWMGDFFKSQLGITVHRDSFDLEYSGKKIHFIHGDGLSPADKGYRILKKILRNRFNIWCYKKLPVDFAFWLAKKVSGSSREYTTRRDHEFAADYEKYAIKKLEQNYDLVAIGHLHIPIQKEFDSGIYINTGDFINYFSYLKIDNNQISLNNIE